MDLLIIWINLKCQLTHFSLRLQQTIGYLKTLKASFQTNKATKSIQECWTWRNSRQRRNIIPAKTPTHINKWRPSTNSLKTNSTLIVCVIKEYLRHVRTKSRPPKINLLLRLCLRRKRLSLLQQLICNKIHTRNTSLKKSRWIYQISLKLSTRKNINLIGKRC